MPKTEEQIRIEEKDSGTKNWLQWGPYISERQWGTVREDYSEHGNAWEYFPYRHAHQRAFRWGEDGIAGISDAYCNLCFGVTVWNYQDDHLKERLFGLTGPQGNHAEDVKELYYYLRNTPTHSYMEHLYKYPQKAFPYEKLRTENQKRSKQQKEFEILDTDAFANNAYFDVKTSYAKADTEDLLIKISITNHGDHEAKIALLPTLWMRNLWDFESIPEKPCINFFVNGDQNNVQASHPYIGEHYFYFEEQDALFFTENETNTQAVFQKPNNSVFTKDLFHTAMTTGDYTDPTSVSNGSKFSPLRELVIDSKKSITLRYRLCANKIAEPFSNEFEAIFVKRAAECDEFYATINAPDHALQNVQNQAFAGLLWSKQYYNFNIEKWLNDTAPLEVSEHRKYGRNHTWKTLKNHDIHLMPDAWEYPWYAAWDSAFHCATMALIDINFAKEQLLLFTKEWYMAPNGQIPAYEWQFSDVNPPIQAWAALQIAETEKKRFGTYDFEFLKKIVNKLALNFTWWVNRKDNNNNNIFEGGFLGLDNIGVFDRSNSVPEGGHLEQVDGTSWMALFSLNLMQLNIIIAQEDNVYEDMAIKYLGHFMYIAESLNHTDSNYAGNWNDGDGFFYDRLVIDGQRPIPIKVRSVVGLLSLTAIAKINHTDLEKLPEFNKSVSWFRQRDSKKTSQPMLRNINERGDLILTLVPKDRALRLFDRLFDTKEFLSPFGFRSLSKVYEESFTMTINTTKYAIKYEPAESTTNLFGGNSNWRGPIWFPINYILIQALKNYKLCFPHALKTKYPTKGSEVQDFDFIINDLTKRLLKLFIRDSNGNRPVHQLHKEFYAKEEQKDLILFYEYFHGNNGRGVGAAHQTGWTALIANLISEELMQ